MYKLEPFVSEKIWGYERWIVSTHKAGQSLVDLDGEKQKLGDFIKGDFPLLIKVIQANQTLSVQVHPDDEYARIHENTFGKTECWYVLDSAPNANLVCGLNDDYSKEQLRTAIAENSLEKCLRYVPVSKGDFIFIPSGTVHAINGGLRLLEVQEPSDVTYRLYDWGRGREIHVEKALEVIKSAGSEPVKDFNGSFKCPFFELNKIDIQSEKEFDFSSNLAVGNSSSGEWLSLFVISGNGSFIAKDNKSCSKEFAAVAEDVFLIKKGEQITVKGHMSVMVMCK